VFDTVVVTRGAEERAVREALARAGARPRVIATGIGPRAAALAAATVLAERPAHALVIGTCGALVPSLGIADVLLYGRVRSVFGDPIVLDGGVAEAVFDAYPAALSGICGISTDRIATRAAEKRALSARFQAHAVDMESYEIVRALQGERVPVAVVRIVSDVATGDLPDLNCALTGSGELDPSSLALSLLAAPLGTLRLAMNGGAAVARFAPVLAALFSSGSPAVRSVAAR